MSKNTKLKKAMIVAIAMIGGAYSLHSQAIGLGDIQVKSYLGQPLAADLKVYGVNSQASASCFRVTSDDTNTINQVSFKLNRTNNGNATLRINSRAPVFEPIASLTIMSTCDTLFTRQYNLLIDPAPTVASAGLGLVTNDADNDRSTNSIFVEDTSNQAIVSTPKRKQAKKRKTRTKAKVKAKRKSTKTSAKRPQPIEHFEPSERADTPLTSDRPLLTISGTSLINSASNSMKLNFDKSINPNREASTILTDADFADEFTVMQNRISHLDKQLSKLSVQNASLKLKSQEQAKELNKVKHQNDFLRILAFCLGGALLASSYFFVDWLRRRNTKLKAEKEQALWHAMQLEQEQAEAKQSFKLDESFDPNRTQIEVIDSDDLSAFENANEAHTEPGIDPVVESTEAPIVQPVKSAPLESQSTEIIEEDTQLLDDAALFVSHGRKSLAVQLLQNHLMEHPKESSSTWMYLLDLLANEGMEEEYKIAAIECNKHFNINIAAFSENNSADENSLESYGRISLELQQIWGTPQAVTFLDELIYNTRIEPRMGFTKAVFEELSLLREIALDEIRLEESSSDDEGNTHKQNRSTTLDLPEIEVSDEFKQFGAKIEKKNAPKEPDEDKKEFEFELLDIDR